MVAGVACMGDTLPHLPDTDSVEINKQLQSNGLDISRQMTERGMIYVVATKGYL